MDDGPLRPPTVRRRAQAREAGLLAHSPVLSRAAAALAGAAALILTAPRAAAECAALLRGALVRAADAGPPDLALPQGLACAAWCIVPVAAAATAAHVVAHMAQTRWWASLRLRRDAGVPVTTQPVRPWPTVWRAARSLLALGLGLVAAWLAWSMALTPAGGAATDAAALGSVLLRAIALPLGVGAAALVVLGFADLAVQRLLLERRLQMTWRQVRDEERDTQRAEYPR